MNQNNLKPLGLCVNTRIVTALNIKKGESLAAAYEKLKYSR